MVIVRFLLRFLLIPLGLVVAALAITAVVVTVSWGQFLALLSVDPDSGGAMAAFLAGGVAMFMVLASAAFAMMTPALFAIAVAEIVAIRSWLYYAATGGLAAWIGWWTMEGIRKDYAVFSEPTSVAAAGIVGGLAYWLVAGWNAGFWKPVFAAAVTPMVPPRAV